MMIKKTNTINKMGKRRTVLGMMLLLCMLGAMLPVIPQAANQRLMVVDYKVSDGQVVAGKEFTLSVVMKNTSQKAVKNIKMTISSENGEILPVDSAGTAYVESVDAGKEETVKCKMNATYGLEEKSYKLGIKLEYEGSYGEEYCVEDAIYLPITMAQRISVSDLYIAPEDAKLGDSVEVTAVVNNLGESTLYNVSVRVYGDCVNEVESYVGNIEPGKSGNLDLLTKAIKQTRENDTSDTMKNKLKVFYEDKAGNQFETEDKDLGLVVSAPVFDKMEVVKKGVDYGPIIRTVVWFIVGIAALVLVILLWIRRKKKKQQLLDEFLD